MAPEEKEKGKNRGKLLTGLWLQGIYVEEYMMEPYPITPTFFSQRLRGVDESLSEMLFTRLQTKGLVDMDGWSQFGNWTDAKEGGW
jgi:hypothetical protein